MLLQENLQPVRNYINDYDYMNKELLQKKKLTDAYNYKQKISTNISNSHWRS